MATAMFGAGCFWGVEEAFCAVKGVTETAVGYAGGKTEKPTYEQVCSDTTGHAEVVRVEYDPAQVSYEKLLEVFWDEHDPTQVNRQGPDFGTQYRTVIFAMDAEQERIAKESKEKLAKSGKYNAPIATEIVPPADFWRAEEYHQQYFSKRRGGKLGLFRR
jgi:peptide-methionine (S)-S-oxide reductase